MVVHKRKKNFAKRITGFPLILGLFAVLLIPSSASASISNGTFESETGSSITGWTAIDSRIDLGVDSIAGCQTDDTTDYTALRDWVSEYNVSPYKGQINSDPAVNNDSLTLTFSSGPTYDTEVVSGVTGTYARSGNVLKMQSRMTATPGGFVVHGPAVYSAPFSAKTIDDLTIAWAAADNGDDYAVLAYLLNTATCAQTEVIDSTGASSLWQSQTVAIPSDGTYRFVFVSGTYDQTHGTVAGGTMYLDDILLTVNQARAAEAAAAASGFSPKPALPEMESYQIGLAEEGNPQLRIEGKRLWCVDSMTIDGVEVPIETGYSTPWYEYLNADITAISPGQKTLVAQSCYGEITYENWVTITPVVAPKSTWFKAQSFGLNETMRQKIAAFNSSLGDGYSKVRCIVNSSNGTELNEAFAKQICAFAQSNDLSHAEVVLQERTTFSGRGYWVNIWASGGYN